MDSSVNYLNLEIKALMHSFLGRSGGALSFVKICKYIIFNFNFIDVNNMY